MPVRKPTTAAARRMPVAFMERFASIPFSAIFGHRLQKYNAAVNVALPFEGSVCAFLTA